MNNINVAELYDKILEDNMNISIAIINNKSEYEDEIITTIHLREDNALEMYSDKHYIRLIDSKGLIVEEEVANVYDDKYVDWCYRVTNYFEDFDFYIYAFVEK